MTKERNYGIDLLRLVLMYMVCILHTLGRGGILRACPPEILNYKIFWLLEIFSYGAVDGFAIISGYMASDKPRKFEKLVEMWFQVFFYSFILTRIYTFLGINQEWSKSDIIRCAMPVTYEKFWYFTAFFVLYFAIPILNKFLFAIDEATAKKSLILMLVLFSAIELEANAFKTQGGYSAIWLIILYCIGVLAKRGSLFEQRKSSTLFSIWMFCVLVTWAKQVLKGNGKLVNYVSPTILMSAIVMVILFSRLKLKGNIISKLSPLAFGIYLFQLNQVFWNVILVNRFIFVNGKSTGVALIYVLAFAALIFVSGLIVEFARSKLANAIKIPALSRKIVKLADSLLTRLFVFLK